MKALPVVTPSQMAEAEKIAFVRGVDPAWCMEMVASGIAGYIHSEGWKRVLILVGTGNNGGDGARLGQLLIERGIDTEILYVEGEASALREQHLTSFSGTKSSLSPFPKRENQLVVDALFGTGFKGPLSEEIVNIIEAVNEEKHTVYSIDIPSGLDGATGQPQPTAFFAKITFYCGCAKEGFFIGSGFAYVGHLIHVPIGIDFQMKAAWHLAGLNLLKGLMPPIDPLRYKFQAGTVSGLVASASMVGAGLLAARSAFRSGCGYVRLAFTEDSKSAESIAPLEAVKYSCTSSDEVMSVLNHADAAWIGPGLPESAVGKKLTEVFFKEVKVPSVIDGGALFHLSQMQTFTLPKNAVLTPHRGEMHRLVPLTGSNSKEDIERCQSFVDEHEVTLVLKGAPTWIFHPNSPVIISPFGDPGMATAGSGDVLTGVIAAQLAAGLEPQNAAILGSAIHGISGQIAARELTSYSLIARDLIEHLPKAIQLVLTS